MARTGRLGSIVYAKETTWGTFASGTDYLRASTESLKRSVEHAEDPSLVSEIYTTNLIKVGDGIAGNIEGVMHGDDIGKLLHGVLGTQSSLANPAKAWMIVGYSGSDAYMRLTKSGDVITAEVSAAGASWVIDSNFSSTGSITVTDAAYDTLSELETYIAGRTGYDCVLLGDSTDSSTIADFTATTIKSASTSLGSLLMKVQPTSTVSKMHTLIPAAASVNLPSFSFTINRSLGTNASIAALGAKISSITLSNTAKDICKYSITLDAKQESTSVTDSGLTAPVIEAFLSANMTIVMEDYTGALTELDEVKDYSITINANLDDNRAIGSYYKKEQERQNSTIEISFTANNTSTQYALRSNYTSDYPVGFYLYWKSNDYSDSTNLVPYSILIRIPAAKLTDFNSPLSTPDRLTITGAATVVKPESASYGEHIYVYVIDDNTSSY